MLFCMLSLCFVCLYVVLYVKFMFCMLFCMLSLCFICLYVVLYVKFMFCMLFCLLSLCFVCLYVFLYVKFMVCMYHAVCCSSLIKKVKKFFLNIFKYAWTFQSLAGGMWRYLGQMLYHRLISRVRASMWCLVVVI